MSGRLAGVLAVAALSVAVLSGCRGPGSSALPAPSAVAADPLAGVEAAVDVVERGVDADSDSGADPGR